MAKFFVGQRVRLTHCENPRLASYIGKETTLLSRSGCYDNAWVIALPPSSCMYDDLAWDEDSMEPLVNPDELAWQAFKSQHLTPDPCLIGDILAKEVA